MLSLSSSSPSDRVCYWTPSLSFCTNALATILFPQRLYDRILKTWNSSFYEEAPLLHGERYLIFTGKNLIIQEFWNILTELSPIFAQFLMVFQLNLTIFWKINWICNIGEKYKNGVSSRQALNLLIHLLQNKKLYTHHIGLQWGAFLRSFFFGGETHRCMQEKKQIRAIHNPTARNPICKDKPS